MNIIVVSQNEILKKQIEVELKREYSQKEFRIKLYFFNDLTEGVLHHFRKKVNHIAVIDIDNADKLNLTYKIKLITNSIHMIYHCSDPNIIIKNVEAFRTTISVDETIKALFISVRRNLKNEYRMFNFYKEGLNIKVSFDDIIYFWSEVRTVHFKTIDGNENYFYEKLYNVENQVYIQKQFIRVSNSYIVNKLFVTKKDGKWLEMCDGFKIKVTKPDVLGLFWEIV